MCLFYLLTGGAAGEQVIPLPRRRHRMNQCPTFSEPRISGWIRRQSYCPLALVVP